jgi:hypothetical protein
MTELIDGPVTADEEMADLAGFEPTEAHLCLVEQADRLIELLIPRLVWCADWRIEVRAIPDAEGASSIRICPQYYTKRAMVEIRPSLLAEMAEPDEDGFEPITLRRAVLHELAHLHYQPFCQLFYNWAAQVNGLPLAAKMTLTDTEETGVWELVDTIDTLLPADLEDLADDFVA